MVRAKKLAGIELIDIKKGKKLGRVKEVFFTPGDDKIKGFIMDCRILSKSDRFICIEDICSIGESIMLSGEHEPKAVARDIDLKNAVANIDRIFGMKVVTEQGERLGYIDDIILDEKSFKIQGYVLTDGIIEDIMSGKSILPYNIDIFFGIDTAIIKDCSGCPVMKNDAWIKKMLKNTGEAESK